MNRRIEKDRVRNILIITLSNIGDAVLTTAAIKVIKREFPASSITLLAGKRAKCVFAKDSSITEVIAYESPKSLKEIYRQFAWLKRKRFDLIVDFRNTLWGIVLFPRYRTPIVNPAVKDKKYRHKKDIHLSKLAALGFDVAGTQPEISFDCEDESRVAQMAEGHKLDMKKRWIALSPGARSHTKRWDIRGFVGLIQWLKKWDFEIILIGNEDDRKVIDKIIKEAGGGVHNFCAETSIPELAALLKKCVLLVTNDSAPLHIASATNTPTLAIFGPTDSSKYAPLAGGSRVIKRDLPCLPCEKALCRFKHECMQSLPAEDVILQAKSILKLS